MIVDRLKHVNYVPFDSLSNKDKFLVLNFLALIFTFVFFTTSSSKLATYILPAYPFMSILLADYWLAKENSKSLKFSSIILSSIILFVGLGGCFIKFFLPETIYLYVKEIQVFTCILFSIVGVLSFYFIYKRDKLKLFVTYVVFMILFSAFGAYHIFNIDYKFGQNDLMRFARYAKDNNLKLGSWSVGKKYSLTYYSESNVVFLINVPHPLIEELFDEGYIVVVRNKDLDLIRSSVNFKTISSGTKYSLITR